MNRFIACLLLGYVIRNNSPSITRAAAPKSATRFSAGNQGPQATEYRKLEKQLQIVENVEKIELVKNYADVKIKLADANMKLATVDIDKLRRELKDH